MNSSESHKGTIMIPESAFLAIMKLATAKIGEDLIFRGFRSILGLVFKETFQLSLLNITLILSPPILADYLLRIGYASYKQVINAKSSATKYDVRTNPSGLLVAKNTAPATLRDFPIRLPSTVKLPINQVIPGPDDLARKVQMHVLESEQAYKSLHSLHSEGENYLCPVCAQRIAIQNGAQVGHSTFCPRNPYQTN